MAIMPVERISSSLGEALQHELSHAGVLVIDGLFLDRRRQFLEGKPTNECPNRSFDTARNGVRGILRAFDQRKAVA